MKDSALTYCIHKSCKQRTGNRNPTVVMEPTKTGKPRYRMSSTCAQCGGKKSTYVPASQVTKMGNGIFGWIPGIGKHLDNLGNKVLDVAVPLAVGAATRRFIG